MENYLGPVSKLFCNDGIRDSSISECWKDAPVVKWYQGLNPKSHTLKVKHVFYHCF